VATEQNRGKPSSDELAAILGELSTDQIRFVVARQEFATDKETAEAIGVKPATVSDWKYKGAPIDDAVRLMALDGIVVATELRRRNLAKAMAVKVAGLDESDARLRQGVATEIIEWEMGKATQKSEVSGPDGGPQEIVLKWPDGRIIEPPR
jgi:hypothetical protein